MVELFEVLWFLLDFLLTAGMDLTLEPLRRAPRAPRQPATELIIGGLVGFGVGLFFSQIVRHRLLPSPPVPGLSLVLVPLVLGLAMLGWGKLRPTFGRGGSAVATWYGGAIVGFGLAAGRLVGLRLL